MSRLEKPAQQANKAKGLQSILSFATAREPPKETSPKPVTKASTSRDISLDARTKDNSFSFTTKSAQNAKQTVNAVLPKSTETQKLDSHGRDNDDFPFESSYMDNSMVSNQHFDSEQTHGKQFSNVKLNSKTSEPPLPKLPSLDSSFSLTPENLTGDSESGHKIQMSDVQISESAASSAHAENASGNLYMPSPSQVSCRNIFYS